MTQSAGLFEETAETCFVKLLEQDYQCMSSHVHFEELLLAIPYFPIWWSSSLFWMANRHFLILSAEIHPYMGSRMNAESYLDAAMCSFGRDSRPSALKLALVPSDCWHAAEVPLEASAFADMDACIGVASALRVVIACTASEVPVDRLVACRSRNIVASSATQHMNFMVFSIFGIAFLNKIQKIKLKIITY
jgi:hypothetical protein